MSRNMVRNLHQDSLVLASWDNVTKHANKFVDPIAFLREYFCLSEEILRGLDLAVAPGKAMHVGGDRQHEPCSPEDVIVVPNVFVVVKDVPGCCQSRSAAITEGISSTSA